MAINTPIDPMAELEELVNSEDTKNTTFAPFFFSIKDGQKALIRPLLNLNQYVRVEKHEICNPASKKFEVKAVCAASLHMQGCIHCAKAALAKSKDEKKLLPSTRIILPIFVHAVIDAKTGEYITYTKAHEDGSSEEIPISGVRLLEMKKSSSILADFIRSYNGNDDSDVKSSHDITTLDYVVRRDGAGTETRYVVTPKAPRALPTDVVAIPDWTHDRDLVLLQYADACPFEIADNDIADNDDLEWDASSKKAAKSVGKPKSIPDF